MITAFLSSILTLTAVLSLSAQATGSRLNPVRTLEQRQPRELQAQTGDSEWPSLRFYFTTKRSSMTLHGHSNFSVLARPVISVKGDDNAGTRVLYDSFASFSEGLAEYNYTTIDGVAYVSRNSPDVDTPLVQCVDSQSVVVPSINSIVSALSEAVAVSSISASNSSTTACSSGSMFKVAVNDIDFGVCASGSSGFAMYGSDIDVKVDYLASQVEILPPKANTGTTDKCKAVAVPTSVSAIGRSLLTGALVSSDSTRMLKAEIVFLLDDSCSCKSKPRPCIFVHGLGIRKEEPKNADERPKYWGDLTDHAPCCTSMKYAVLDSIKYSWTDKIQQQKSV